MLKGILFFCAVWLLAHLGVYAWRSLSGREQFTLIKALTYSLACAIIAAGFILLIVVLF